MSRNLALLAIGLALAGCTVTTTALVPNSTDSTTVTRRQGTMNPVISSLTASPTALSRPGQALSIQVSAYDPRGENLRYTWSATGGTLSTTTGTLVTWKSPTMAGTYTVQVLVTNDSGGTAAGTLNIQVNADGTGTVSNPSIGSSGTTDSGTTTPQALEWSVISPGIDFSDCSFVSFSSGWVVGQKGIRHTSNAGATWVNQTTPAMDGLDAVYFLPASGGTLGWAAGANQIFRTTDGGAHWTTSTLGGSFYPGYGPFIKGIYFQDAQHGAVVASGDSSGLYVTEDGGATWTKTAAGTFGNLLGLGDGTMFATPVPSIYQDLGPTRRYKAGGINEAYPKTFEFISGEPGAPANVLASKASSLARSHDGGIAWEEVQSDCQIEDWDSLNWRGLALFEGNQVLGIRAKRQVYDWGDATYYVVESSDGGTHWAKVATLNVGDLLRVDYQTKPRFFGFDRRHAWQAYIDNSKLLRIGAP